MSNQEANDVLRRLARDEQQPGARPAAANPELAALQLRELRSISRYCRVIAIMILVQFLLAVFVGALYILP